MKQSNQKLKLLYLLKILSEKTYEQAIGFLRIVDGKYVLDDIGVTKFMNYGIRNGFGPVILDYPYAYELDGKKLICNKSIKTPYGMVPCGGEIDYDSGLNNLVCCKCGRTYSARELAKDDSNVLKFGLRKNKVFLFNRESEMRLR